MPLRIWIAMGIVCLAVLGSTLDLPVPPPDPYKIDVQLDRLGPVLSELPHVPSAGYISDVRRETTAGSTAFYTAQFAIAPVLLEDEAKTKHEWAVGNFSTKLDFSAAGRQVGQQIEKDLGNGVILFRRPNK